MTLDTDSFSSQQNARASALDVLALCASAIGLLASVFAAMLPINDYDYEVLTVPGEMVIPECDGPATILVFLLPGLLLAVLALLAMWLRRQRGGGRMRLATAVMAGAALLCGVLKTPGLVREHARNSICEGRS